MNNKLLVLIGTLFISAVNAGEININLHDVNGRNLKGYYGCEWRMMNEDGTPHPSNPMYGTAYKGILKSGTRWIVSVNCGDAGSGSHQIISSNGKEEYVIQLHKLK